ncbi:amino acid/amide ABC transporter substrate-binding protein, HAAT family [Trichlorobacter thiogenes]|uniref:Amino acid/amide ABC transporter substrate-binding protein, HAAT family n=1 Tax=Trichlorobacter thiogenes TaxID=115783 RepID=A0A1T4MJ73_9BACT|nr:ABC transporter substrate-binding protein [Trichlorobacter thiogenes]SJZ66788.1 amino acid/amide ABC transporter substrate-binding protein, HAAT family [Trichlorobacter thiogenes]
MFLFRIAAVFCCLLSLLIACSPKKPVKIGFLGGMSGRVADLGVAGRNGAMLAIEQRNTAGGIHGQQVELVVKDDGQNSEVAQKAVAELLNSNIELIIGPMTSSIALAVLDQVNASKAILLAPTVSTTALTGKNDNFLRIIGDTSTYATKLARYQAQKFGHRRVAVIYDLNNRSYTESWFGDFKREFELHGGSVVAVETYHSLPTTSFHQLATTLLKQKPELVVIITNAVDAALICQQIRKQDAAVSIGMAEWASTERFIELAGGAAEGVLVSQFVNRTDPSERYQRFLKQYRERFGGQEPGFAGLAGYDAALAAMDAYAARKSGETLKQTIIRLNSFQGGQQKYQIDRFGDANRLTTATIVRNGIYQTLE